ncbi:hypothetical protein BV22DRAFT_597269 [Leucogyrophana mollusca]|uniref:Uncharacterized protein n=1 Tax=Leucogyrophana mollusca TaxID=85980 RepID=A0ACB8BCC3_9AGAM|nr:hypothetical protein BV22DRAFT_597269 [Leucogyrophana mollusca]
MHSNVNTIDDPLTSSIPRPQGQTTASSPRWSISKAWSTRRNVDIQHCRPIKNTKRTTGEVYCPSALYEGWVTASRAGICGQQAQEASAYTHQVSAVDDGFIRWMSVRVKTRLAYADECVDPCRGVDAWFPVQRFAPLTSCTLPKERTPIHRFRYTHIY